MIKINHLSSLTGMRFILALWVVLFHLRTLISPGGSSFAFGLLHTGYVPVGFFYVLSGFVLAYRYPLIETWSTQQLKKFAVARFAKIYPAYLIAFALVLPVLFGANGIVRNRPLGSAGALTANAILHLTFLQAWIPGAALSLNPPGWSISNEAFFYVCFPFLGIALWRITRRPVALAAACAGVWILCLAPAAIAMMTALPDIAGVRATADIADSFWPNLIKFNPVLRLPEFCMGILTARIYRWVTECRPGLIGRGHSLYIPALLAIGGVLATASSIPYVMLHNGLLLPLCASTILGFALSGGTLAKVLAQPPVIFLGNASYSLYILHVPIFYWMNGAAKRSLGHEPAGIAWVLFATLGAVAGSALIFTALEEPLRKLLMRTCLPEQRRSPSPSPQSHSIGPRHVGRPATAVATAEQTLGMTS